MALGPGDQRIKKERLFPVPQANWLQELTDAPFHLYLHFCTPKTRTSPFGLHRYHSDKDGKGFSCPGTGSPPARCGHLSRHVMGPNIVIITSQEEFDFKFGAFYTSDPQKLTRHLQILGPAGRPQDLGHAVVLTVPLAQALPVDMAHFNAHYPPSKQLPGAWPHAPSCPSTGKDSWAPGKEHAWVIWLDIKR